MITDIFYTLTWGASHPNLDLSLAPPSILSDTQWRYAHPWKALSNTYISRGSNGWSKPSRIRLNKTNPNSQLGLGGLANQSSNNPLFSTLRVSNLWGAGRSVGFWWGSLYEALISDRPLHALLMWLSDSARFCFAAHAPSTRSEQPTSYDVGGRWEWTRLFTVDRRSSITIPY